MIEETYPVSVVAVSVTCGGLDGFGVNSDGILCANAKVVGSPSPTRFGLGAPQDIWAVTEVVIVSEFVRVLCASDSVTLTEPLHP